MRFIYVFILCIPIVNCDQTKSDDTTSSFWVCSFPQDSSKMPILLDQYLFLSNNDLVIENLDYFGLPDQGNNAATRTLELKEGQFLSEGEIFEINYYIESKLNICPKNSSGSCLSYRRVASFNLANDIDELREILTNNEWTDGKSNFYFNQSSYELQHLGEPEQTEKLKYIQLFNQASTEKWELLEFEDELFIKLGFSFIAHIKSWNEDSVQFIVRFNNSPDQEILLASLN